MNSPLAVFWIFLRLGFTSFGGPIAHLGYLRTEFVERRRWLDDAAFADLVAICQLTPGPASSKLGIALGASPAGIPGALAARLRAGGHRFVSSGLVEVRDPGLGFARGLVVRDPDGHAMRIVETAEGGR